VDFTSGTRQNEILEMFSHAIVNHICDEVRKAGMFSIIVDGTHDVSGTEQQSMCIRYVDEELKPIEAFLGLYESPDTTGQTIASCVFDVLTRLQLPLNNLRGQTFDGTSNMSGSYKGCQAIIRQRPPLALYTHCGSHCSNLVAEKVCSLGPLLRNSIQVVQETGAVFSASIKVRTAFLEISQVTDSNIKKIKPLCPTRWLVRVSAIKNILDQYRNVLQTVEEIGASSASVAARANGLASQLRRGSTVLGLHMALKVLNPLEELNCSLQSRSMTVAGMLLGVEEVINHLEGMRCEIEFAALLEPVNVAITAFELEPITVPRQRSPPARFTGDAEAYQATSVSTHHCPHFFEAVDTAVNGLKDRFTESSGLQQYSKLESILLSGVVVEDAIKQYPEINIQDLQLELAMFNRKHVINKVSEAVNIFGEMVPEVRTMYNNIEVLVQLLLVCPASSAEAERSFSSLRRLKTWLRSTMTERRLNSVCVPYAPGFTGLCRSPCADG
jgi:hypothetical protein